MLEIVNSEVLYGQEAYLAQLELKLEPILKGVLHHDVKITFSAAPPVVTQVLPEDWLLIEIEALGQIALEISKFLYSDQPREIFTYIAVLSERLGNRDSDRKIEVCDPTKASSSFEVHQVSLSDPRRKEVLSLQLGISRSFREAVATTEAQSLDSMRSTKVSLNIGQLLIPLNDLLNLRAGMRIICSPNEPVPITLSLNEQKLFKAQLKIENNKMLIEIFSMQNCCEY